MLYSDEIFGENDSEKVIEIYLFDNKSLVIQTLDSACRSDYEQVNLDKEKAKELIKSLQSALELMD